MLAVLALDQGSHASRACLFDERGALRATAQVPVSTQRSGVDRVEQDPFELVESLRTAACQCLAAAPELRVTHAGLAVQRSSLVCADRDSGKPLSAVLSWQDRRHAAWLQQFQPQEARVRALTGLPLSPHYGASKMRWCLDHLEPVRRAADAGALLLLPLAGWLVGQLCGGAPCVDPANASRTLLLDTATLDWSRELLQSFGIPRAALPDCVPTCGDYGALQGCGETQPIGLRACTGDQSAVPFFAGDADANSAYINLGTGAFLQRPLRQRPTSPAPLLGSVLRGRDGSAGIGSGNGSATLYSLEGTVNGAGSAVSQFAAAEHCAEAALWQALETVNDAALPLFVNAVGGLGSPWWRAGGPIRFVDDHGSNTLQRFAALIESIVFMLAENFRLLLARGEPLQRVLLVGGMSRSDWLCQRLATLCAAPVERFDGEATARGVAALADPGVAAGWEPGIAQRFLPAMVPGLLQREERLLALLATP